MADRGPRWRCRVPNCPGKGHDGPSGAAAHVDKRHNSKDASLSSGVSFGFTSYEPRHKGQPAYNQPWAGQ